MRDKAETGHSALVLRTKGDRSVSLPLLARLSMDAECIVVSTDLFDTVLLRDSSTETQRLAEAARRAAAQLGVDANTLVRLRWLSHDASYQAVAVERPMGDAALTQVARVVVSALGLPGATAQTLIRAEIKTDITHLSANRPLLKLLAQLRADGRRVIAISDTYYSARELRRILASVVGSDPFDEIYSSADLGLTKHAGSIFPEVLRRENVPARGVLHIGDDLRADVDRPSSAGWSTVHAPRARAARALRRLGKVARTPLGLARYR